jgi:hypothetical protein
MRVLLALIVLSPLGFAEAPKADPGFELLFNGKDFTGWKPLGKKESLEGKTEAYKGRFKARDGELVIDPTVKGDVRIETVREFAKDAVVKFEFFPDAKCNNDLFFRGQKFDLSKANVKTMKPGEWNSIEIAIKDGKIAFTVNGMEIRSAATKNARSTFGIRAEFGAIRIRNLQVKEGT